MQFHILNFKIAKLLVEIISNILIPIWSNDLILKLEKNSKFFPQIFHEINL